MHRLHHLFCDPPIKQRVDCRELVEQHYKPKDELERTLRSLVSEHSLRQESSGPTSHQRQKVKRRLGNAPLSSFRAPLVTSIYEKRYDGEPQRNADQQSPINL